MAKRRLGYIERKKTRKISEDNKLLYIKSTKMSMLKKSLTEKMTVTFDIKNVRQFKLHTICAIQCGKSASLVSSPSY